MLSSTGTLISTFDKFHSFMRDMSFSAFSPTRNLDKMFLHYGSSLSPCDFSKYTTLFIDCHNVHLLLCNVFLPLSEGYGCPKSPITATWIPQKFHLFFVFSLLYFCLFATKIFRHVAFVPNITPPLFKHKYIIKKYPYISFYCLCPYVHPISTCL